MICDHTTRYDVTFDDPATGVFWEGTALITVQLEDWLDDSAHFTVADLIRSDAARFPQRR